MIFTEKWLLLGPVLATCTVYLKFINLTLTPTFSLDLFSPHINNTPSFKLAKFLVPILNPFTSNEFTTANSHSFANDIMAVEEASHFFMTSFDVENLFTNIPLNETINICLNHLFTDPSSLVIGLSRKFFKTLLELSVLYSFFTFNRFFLDRLMG